MTRRSGHKPVVLAVDDEQENVDFVIRTLRASFECYATTDPVEALSLLDRNRVDLIVSDMRMPGIGGAELLARARRSNPGACRIILSAYSDPQDMVAATNDAGVSQYLVKPIDSSTLKKAALDAVAEAQNALRAAEAVRSAQRLLTARSTPAAASVEPATDVTRRLQSHVERARRFVSHLAVGILQTPSHSAAMAAYSLAHDVVGKDAEVGMEGNGELLLILPDLSQEDAADCLEDVVSRVRRELGRDAVSRSCLAFLPRDGTSAEELLAAARRKDVGEDG